ncbi:hypothetical protein [Leifsonia shinshuensis]
MSAATYRVYVLRGESESSSGFEWDESAERLLALLPEWEDDDTWVALLEVDAPLSPDLDVITDALDVEDYSPLRPRELYRTGRAPWRIRKASGEYPWHYWHRIYTGYEYGSVATFTEAVVCVNEAIAELAT